MYAPTFSYCDEEVSKLYIGVQSIMNREPAHCNVILGDFNAEVGKNHLRQSWHKLSK